MNFTFTEMQEMIRDTAREIGEDIIKPNRARWDEEELYPSEALEALAQADMMGIYIP
jgi:alkylation response protein AidB-like acyl-CoA dehydrogenase